jgi:hypothetical protein
MRTLEVGDKIYRIQYGRTAFFGTIDRVTKTMAFIENIKFKRKFLDSYVDLIGESIWSSTSFQIENPDLKQKAEKEYKIQFIKNNFHLFYNQINSDIINALFFQMKDIILKKNKK